MGKMGAGELNYSSDIDLIVFFDPAATSLVPDIEPAPFFVRVTQALARLLQQRSGDGYVFRVDLRLRPDPASTQVAMSIEAALHYYEREGRTWERAAMIKARPCAGDAKAGEALVAEIAPFVWRKHLDFAALADVHDMKRQMQTYRGQSEIAVEGHNVKVGRGGIREIEFFAQTQQLIAGGRHPELRVRPTLQALKVLASSNWITFQARDELTAAYEFLRRVEHRLQMIADEQTHALPDEAEAVERFAHFFGYESRAAFAKDLLGHLNIVQGHYGKLFEGDPTGSAKLPDVNYGAGPEDPRLLEHLATLGFKKPVMVAGTVQQWMAGDYRALRDEATRNAFVEFIPGLIDGLAHAEEPDDAVTAFDRFLGALQRGGRLISLLSQNRDLVALVALILGAAPRLGDMLARQPQIMDGLIDPRFFGAMPDQKELSARLAGDAAGRGFLRGLPRSPAAVRPGKPVPDRHAHSLRHGVGAAGQHRLCRRRRGHRPHRAWPRHRPVRRAIRPHQGAGDRDPRDGPARQPRDDGVLRSRPDPALRFRRAMTPDSDGERSLHGAQYFARLTQRLISAFTTRTNYGVLYDVDMRLRPSGRAGPVASRIDSFADYQEREAWTWEHMALTRARVISASPAFRKKIEDIIRSVLTRPRDPASTAGDVADMRRAIALEKGEDDIWDLKLAAGGLVDIDFIAQYLQLAHAAEKPDILSVSTLQVLDNAARLGVLPQAEAEVLRSAARLYHDLTQILRLCVTGKFNPETAGEDLLRVMARAGDTPDFSTLEARVRETQAEVRRVFREVVG